jgi:uncharacterized protein (DUF952 family)
MPSAEYIYHIADPTTWENSLSVGQYSTDSLKAEGFIHFSGREQVIGTANRYYQGQHGMLLLKVIVAKLAADLKYEIAPNGDLFPHLYGPLNLEAVVKVFSFEPDSNGLFVSIPE